MRMKFGKSLWCLTLFFPVFLSAQQQAPADKKPFRIFGSIADSGVGKPLSGATIALPELRRGVRSDETGAFIVDSVFIVPHFMIVTADGYAVKRVAFMDQDFSAPLKIGLLPSAPDSTRKTVLAADTAKALKSGPIDTNASSATASAPVSPEKSAVPESRVVTGKVLDGKTKQPLLSAMVSCALNHTTTASNQNGEFTLTLPVSSCSLSVARNNYEPVAIAVDSGALLKKLEIALARSSTYELQEMSINAGRIDVKQMMKTSDKISQVEMSPELMAKLPSVGQADLFRSLQLLPGVSGTNESSSGLFVRGGTPDQNLIMLNDIPVYYVDHFYGFFSAFNPNAIDNVTMYKGGFGAEYGGRTSSVVDLSSTGKDLSSDSSTTAAGVGAGLLSSDAFVQIPLINKDVGTLMIAGRRSMTDVFHTDLFDQLFSQVHGNDSLSSATRRTTAGGAIGGALQNNHIVYQPTFSFWDVNALAAFKLGQSGLLTTTFFGSHDDQDNSLDTSWSTKVVNPVVSFARGTTGTTFTRDTLRYDTVTTTNTINHKDPLGWGNICAAQGWEQKWTDLFKSKLTVSYSQFLDAENESDNPSTETSNRYSDTTKARDTTVSSSSGVTSTNEIIDVSGRLDNSFKVTDWNTVSAGLEASRKIVTYEHDSTASSATTVTGAAPGGAAASRFAPVGSYDTSMSAAAYAEDDMKFGDKGGLTPGLRGYYFRLIHQEALDPRVSGWYKPTDHLKLQGAWGIYTQELQRVEEENITGGSKFVWLLADANRPLEKSVQYIAGASWENKRFIFDVEGYVKTFTGLEEISQRDSALGVFNPGTLPVFQGTGLAKGLEFLAQVKDERFTLFDKNAVYNGWLSYTLSSVENTFAVFNNGNPFPATQDHPNEVKIVNTLAWDVNAWSNIDFSAVWLYSTGAPYTAPLGSYTLTLLDSTQRTYMHVSNENQYRLPDYHRLDLSLAWKVHFNKHFTGGLTAGVFNAYNRQNIIARTYSQTLISSSPATTAAAAGFTGAGAAAGTANQTSVFTAVDQAGMPIMPNIALDLSMKF